MPTQILGGGSGCGECRPLLVVCGCTRQPARPGRTHCRLSSFHVISEPPERASCHRNAIVYRSLSQCPSRKHVCCCSVLLLISNPIEKLLCLVIHPAGLSRQSLQQGLFLPVSSSKVGIVQVTRLRARGGREADGPGHCMACPQEDWGWFIR